MNLNYLAASLAASLLACSVNADQPLSTKTPPRLGEPVVWSGAWRTKETLHKADKFVLASTDSPARFFQTYTTRPNEEMEDMFVKPKSFPPSRVTNPPATSEFGIATNPLATSHIGIGQTTLTPPDNDVAVGDNYIVEVVNSTFRITDKCGNNLFTSTINTFLGDNGFLFDPKVFFDPWRRRWSMLWHRRDTAAGTSHLVTVSSDNDDPFGSWYVWYFRVDDGNTRWIDYCDWGYGSNSVEAAGNMFAFAGGFVHARYFTFNPSEIYNNVGASVTWTNWVTNPDGSTTFAPRVAKQMNVGQGGAVFVNSRSGGGTRLTVRRLTDPLGARTWSSTDINVNSYSVPPDITDPGGRTIQTNSCQMMPAYNSFNATANKWRMFTSLNTSNPSQAGTCSSRLYILDPFANTVELDWNFWPGGGNSFCYSSPSVNYTGSCNWTVTYAGPSVFGSATYTNFEPAGFTNTIAFYKSGTSSYTGSRWGDYHGGSMDWGDYWNSSASQKMWMTGEYVANINDWGTYIAAAISSGTSAGVMNIGGAGSMTFSGFTGGPFSPSGYSNTVSNSGSVGFNWQVTTPSWLSADVGSGQVFSGGSQTVNVGPNGATNGLPFGRHVGNVVYENCYNNATTSIPATALVFGLVHPSSYSITFGRLNSGNLASLNSVDGNNFQMCKFLVPNTTVPPIRVEFSGTSPSNTVGYVDFIVYAKMVTNGLFSHTMEMWNYNTNNWDAVDLRTDVINTVLTRWDLISSGNHSRFIGPANAIRARISIRQTGPAANPNWCSDHDFAGWIIAPQ